MTQQRTPVPRRAPHVPTTPPPQQSGTPRPLLRTPARRAIDEWEEALRINENDLDVELVRQPDVFYRVSKAAALLQSRKDAAAQNVKEVEARAEAKIREAAELREEKVTEKSVASQVVMHPDVQEARDNLHIIATELGEMSALRDAFKERSYALRGLVDLYIANYYSDASNGSAQRQRTEATAASVKREWARGQSND